MPISGAFKKCPACVTGLKGPNGPPLKCIFLNKMSSMNKIILKLEEIYDYCF